MNLKNSFKTYWRSKMALNTSGPISVEDINEELGRAVGAAFDMNGADERALVGVPSGSYSWDDWWGKANDWASDFVTIVNPNAHGTSAGELFGQILAVSDSYVAVGVARETETGVPSDLQFSGKVYVFNIDTGLIRYTVDNPNLSGTADNDSFGNSVAITDTYLVVGSNETSSVPLASPGRVYVFDASTGNYLRDISNADIASGFGDSESRVAVYGTTIAISAPHADSLTSSPNSGKVLLYNATNGNLIATIQNPNALGDEDNDLFGRYSLAMGPGGKIIVGAYADGVGSNDTGTAYIFDITNGNLLQTLVNPDVADASDVDNFGYSVAIYGDYCVVGAPAEGDATFTSNVGKIYVFNTNTGALVHTISGPNVFGTTQYDFLGNAVGITDSYIVSGMNGEDNANFLRTGGVHVYDLVTGNPTHAFVNPNAHGTEQDDHFGQFLVASDTHIVCGSPYEDDANGFSSGVIYIKSKT